MENSLEIQQSHTINLPVEDIAIRKKEKQQNQTKEDFSSTRQAFRIENREKKSRELDGSQLNPHAEEREIWLCGEDRPTAARRQWGDVKVVKD